MKILFTAKFTIYFMKYNFFKFVFSSRTSICATSLSSSSSVNVRISDCTQPTRKKRRINNDNFSVDRQEQISQAIAYMISANRLPISFVQSDGFKQFMLFVEPSYQIPVASTILSQLQLLYGELRAKIMNALSSVSFVALKTDGWSSRA